MVVPHIIGLLLQRDARVRFRLVLVPGRARPTDPVPFQLATDEVKRRSPIGLRHATARGYLLFLKNN